MSPDAISPFDRFVLGFADWITRRPWAVIATVVLMALAAASGVRHLEFSNNYRAFFSEKNPDLIAFDDFQATYTKNDNILFVVQPQDGEVFTAETTAAIERLTAEAWSIPYALRVDSITNFQHTWSQEDDLTVEDLVRDGRSLSTAELAAKRDVALAEPLLYGNLLATDSRTTGVNVTLQYPEESILEVPEAVGAAREIAARLATDFPQLEIRLTGLSMLNNAFAEAGQQDAGTLMPAMFLTLVVLMVLVLRSRTGAFATLLVIGFSAATALGLAGYAGLELTPISVTAPVIILTLAIADSVHILITMLAAMREGSTKGEALRESLRINFVPVVITTVTTIVGFSTLNFSDAPPFHDLGNLTSLGIAAALLYSMTLLPALLTVMPVRTPRSDVEGGWLLGRLDRLGGWVVAKYRPVLATSMLLAMALVALVPLVDLDDQWIEYFDHRVTFRGDAEFALDHLTGLYQVEFSVPSAEAEGISDPIYLQNLERFAAWLREQPEVRHVTSYSDIIQRLNRNLHGDDPAWHRIPDDRQMAAQYLLLYELSLPFGLDMNDRISVDKSATRVTATIDALSTKDTRTFLEKAEGWFRNEAPEFMRTTPTGASVMFAHISERNIHSMLEGNVLAVVLIALVMSMALRSWKLGVFSLIPNALPILMTFGLWAILVGKVGMAAATVSASSLGIIVDDTVHFLTKYLRGRREKGLSAEEAIRYAFRTTGVAIVVTTVILTAGFLVLALSTFKINFELGLLTAIAIAFALAVDFLLLPALLLAWDHRLTDPKQLVLQVRSPRPMPGGAVPVPVRSEIPHRESRGSATP